MRRLAEAASSSSSSKAFAGSHATAEEASKTATRSPWWHLSQRRRFQTFLLVIVTLGVVTLLTLVQEFELLESLEQQHPDWFCAPSMRKGSYQYHRGENQSTEDEPCVEFDRGHLERAFEPPPDHCFRVSENRKHIVDMLSAMARVFTAHNLTFFIDSGTFLGAYRDQTMIPFDTDADVGIDHEAFEKLRTSPDIVFPEGYKVVMINSTLYEDGGRDEAVPARIIDKSSGFFVDLFVYYESVSFWTREPMMGPVPSVCFMGCMNCPRISERAREFKVPKKWIFPLATCTFDGVQLPCPNNARKFLRHMYGKCFMVPKQWY